MQLQEVPTLAEDYYWEMAARSRLIIGQHDGHLCFLCTFFLLQDTQAIHKCYCKLPYEIVKDTEDGTLVYIDHIVSYIPFTREILREIESRVTERHPHWTQAVWYRPRHGDLPDRKYTMHRGGVSWHRS